MSKYKNNSIKAAIMMGLTLPTFVATGAAYGETTQVINYSDGSQYKGQLKDGNRHGHGIIQWANGDRYEGDWESDQPHGYGIKTYIDSSVYEGDFVQGSQHGKGLFTYPDGTTYNGDWQNDSPNGLGTFSFKAAGTYEGSVVLGLPHGQGSFTYSNGDFYDGQWEHGKREGMGKLRYNSGDLLVGTFVDGDANGSGSITYTNGQRYKGNFKQGKPHGDGTCSKSDEQALCSYENGNQVAYAVIPSYLNETSPAPAEIEVATIEPLTPAAEPILVASATKANFVEKLTSEKESLKPSYSVDDLNPQRSDILFNHNFESLKLAKTLRTGTWKKKSSLFNDHLVIDTRSGDLKLTLKIKLFNGPGTYHVKASDIKAWFKGESLEGLQEFANTITIKEIDNQWVEGNINVSFKQKDHYGDYYKVEDGVFRLNNQPIYNPTQ